MGLIPLGTSKFVKQILKFDLLTSEELLLYNALLSDVNVNVVKSKVEKVIGEPATFGFNQKGEQIELSASKPDKLLHIVTVSVHRLYLSKLKRYITNGE